MTIKEIEGLTGLPRANVRYYETEGLIAPERKENGYRVYSQTDAEELMKIKLLRCLEVSIEEIKEIQAGKQTMKEALEKSLEIQSGKQHQLQRAMEIARRMLAEEVSYEMLDAAVWMRQLESEEILQQDKVPALNLPWRRYFARDLDYMLCNLVALMLFYDYLNSRVVTMVATAILLLLTEPLLLHLFGTTPGKWIFGIRVTDGEERRLSYGAGLERTWTVLWEGEALRIPVILYYFLYKNYKACENGEKLPWEWDSEVTYKDDKVWRCGAYVLAYLAVMALLVLVVLWREGIL